MDNSPFEKYYEESRFMMPREGERYLRKNVPELMRLESVESLKNLELFKADWFADCMVIVAYRARVESPPYPRIGKVLIDAGAATGENIVSSKIRNKGMLSEYVRLHLAYYDGDLSVVLSVRKL